MSIEELNKYLVEKLFVLEGRRPKSAGPGYDPDKGHKWITVRGARIMLDKKGKAVGGPEKVCDNLEGVTHKQVQDNLDKLTGKDSKFKASEREDGQTEIGHEDFDEKVEVSGPSMFDTVTSMMSYVDLLTAAAMKVSGFMAKKMIQAAGDLHDVLEQWSNK